MAREIYSLTDMVGKRVRISWKNIQQPTYCSIDLVDQTTGMIRIRRTSDGRMLWGQIRDILGIMEESKGDSFSSLLLG